jgi:hypothetical protein
MRPDDPLSGAAMKHLSDIDSLMPPDSFYVIIVATKEGTGVDTNIQPASKAKEFVLERGREMKGPRPA